MEDSNVKIFDNITLNGQSSGVLKLHAGGFGWKGRETGRVVTCPARDIQKWQWLRTGNGCQLRIEFIQGQEDANKVSNKSGSSECVLWKLDGFRDLDIQSLSEFINQQFHMNLNEVPTSLKGWNWGEVDFVPNGTDLVFKHEGKHIFELPMFEVANCGLSGKNEVSMEFRTDDSKEIRDDSLVEIRFYIPGTVDDGNDEGRSLAEDIEDKIKRKANLGITSGESIVSFEELPCLTPRGRYNVEMFPTFMRLHGKTYDYKISYGTVTRLFLLPKPDEQHVLFVVGIDPPLRQGQTRYPFLILQFLRDDEISVSLNISDENLKSKYDGKLRKEYSAPTFEVVSSVFKALTERNITIPGSFRNRLNSHAVKCAVKANDGYLYPLEKALFFIPKPTIYIRHADIASVEFGRYHSEGISGASSRSFDLKVLMKGGVEHQFANIAREEYQNLYNFIIEKNLTIRNIVSDKRKYTEDFEEDDESDEDMDAEVEEDEESEVDEDYRPPSDEEEVKEEFDENYSSESEGEAEGQNNMDSDGNRTQLSNKTKNENEFK